MANTSWKIARRSNTQLPLVIVIALAIVLVLLGKAQSSLFDRVRVQFTDWMAPALETVRAPVAGFGRWAGSITDIFAVYQQNLKLKEENARLRQWRNAAIVLEGRVRRYQSLLHAVPDPGVKAMLARVIGRHLARRVVARARGCVPRVLHAGLRPVCLDVRGSGITAEPR